MKVIIENIHFEGCSPSVRLLELDQPSQCAYVSWNRQIISHSNNGITRFALQWSSEPLERYNSPICLAHLVGAVSTGSVVDDTAKQLIRELVLAEDPSELLES